MLEVAPSQANWWACYVINPPELGRNCHLPPWIMWKLSVGSVGQVSITDSTSAVGLACLWLVAAVYRLHCCHDWYQMWQNISGYLTQFDLITDLATSLNCPILYTTPVSNLCPQFVLENLSCQIISCPLTKTLFSLCFVWFLLLFKAFDWF